jgi:hypothetical protein
LEEVKAAFPLPLVVEDGGMRGGSRLWRLVKPFRFQGARCINVPVGFITDGASVPRLCWPLFSPTGSYLGAAVIHDFLYSSKVLTRKESDLVFLEAMKAAGVGLFTRRLVFAAVRVGGWAAWKTSTNLY